MCIVYHYVNEINKIKITVVSEEKSKWEDLIKFDFFCQNVELS